MPITENQEIAGDKVNTRHLMQSCLSYDLINSHCLAPYDRKLESHMEVLNKTMHIAHCTRQEQREGGARDQ